MVLKLTSPAQRSLARRGPKSHSAAFKGRADPVPTIEPSVSHARCNPPRSAPSENIRIGMTLRAIFVGILFAAYLFPQSSIISVGQLKAKAEGGEAAAQFELGVRYHEGRGVPQDYAEAMRWFRKAADQGNVDAEFNLGVMFEKGRGVPVDYEQAVQFYREAAIQDYAPAEYNLGVMFDKARGVPQDFPAAMKWYQKAADQGYAAAQYNLGLLYFYGQGAAQDSLTADMWIKLAVSLATGADRLKFSDMRDNVEGHMTADQVAEAERMAKAWGPAVPK